MLFFLGAFVVASGYWFPRLIKISYPILWGSSVHKREGKELREEEGKWRGISDERKGKGRKALSQQLMFLLPT